MKTNELTGAALDWAVQQCEGARKDIDFAWWTETYEPSTNWAQGGPIIEREGICFSTNGVGVSMAWIYDGLEMCFLEYGSTPLIAAMRCFVASKMGDEIEIPKELTA
jgi:hypothetical protein